MIDPVAISQIDAPNKPEREDGIDQLKVLLVDHNAFARSVGRRALQSAGILSILEATSGREAIEFLSRPVLAIDIVFCDLMMPDMDGIQIVRHMATLTAAPAIEIGRASCRERV